MIRKRTKIISTVAAGLLLLGVAAAFVHYKVALRAEVSSSEFEISPFKFASHRMAGTNGGASLSGTNGDGLADFTSNIPVIVLRCEAPGPVSKTRGYSLFQMSVYEPRGSEPVRLNQSPTLSTR